MFDVIKVNKISNTVYVVDDDRALSESLSWLLESVHLEVKTYDSGRAFLEAYQLSWRGCLLIDVRMPIMSGLQLQEKLVTKGNAMPLIMLSGHGDIDMAVRALKAGAIDFITKPFNNQILLEKVQNALVQDQPQLMESEVEKHYNALTARERTVIRKIADGKSNKIIAAELKLSSRTVELHRRHVMRKMGTKNLASLVKMYCLLKGLALTVDDGSLVLSE